MSCYGNLCVYFDKLLYWYWGSTKEKDVIFSP